MFICTVNILNRCTVAPPYLQDPQPRFSFQSEQKYVRIDIEASVLQEITAQDFNEIIEAMSRTEHAETAVPAKIACRGFYV